MKRITIMMLMVISFVISASAQKTYVLTAGISDYGMPDQINNLQMPAKDAQEIAQIFKKQGAVVGTITGKHVTLTNLNKKIDALVQLAKPNDKIIVYLSGHGAPGFYVCYQGDFLYYSKLAEKLSSAKTKKVFVFVDACHAGSAKNAVAGGSGLNGVEPVFCMASRPDEVSWERSFLDNGLFTQALLKGLRGKADYNGDKKVTLMELFKYTYNDVTAKTSGEEKQHPQLIGNSALFETIMTSW